MKKRAKKKLIGQRALDAKEAFEKKYGANKKLMKDVDRLVNLHMDWAAFVVRSGMKMKAKILAI